MVALDATLPELNKIYSDCTPFASRRFLTSKKLFCFLIFLPFQTVTADRSITQFSSKGLLSDLVMNPFSFKLFERQLHIPMFSALKGHSPVYSTNCEWGQH